MYTYIHTYVYGELEHICRFSVCDDNEDWGWRWSTGCICSYGVPARLTCSCVRFLYALYTVIHTYIYGCGGCCWAFYNVVYVMGLSTTVYMYKYDGACTLYLVGKFVCFFNEHENECVSVFRAKKNPYIRRTI